MEYPWRHDIQSTPSGGYKLTVFPPLKDFELYAATREELEADWKDALESHLSGYIAAGKVIPIPHARLQYVSTRGATGGTQQFRVEGGRMEPLNC
jgi:predicted RNase H-like HicB family nuclease